MFGIIIAAVVVADQLSKYAVQSTCVLNKTIPFLPGFLDFTYVHNYGAAFSILQNKQIFLILFTTAAMLAITGYVLRQQKNLPKAEVAAFALIVGGGLGNLINRVVYGYVVDFINIYLLPVFNVADMAVCAGSALLLYSVMILEPKLQQKK